MTADIDNGDGPKRQSVLANGMIVAATALLLVTLVILAIVWFTVGRTTDIAPIPPVADTIPTNEPDEATSKALIVLGGATQLHRDPGAYGSYHVAYALAEKFPAPKAIQQISSRLKALGSTPLENDWLNPGLPSSHVRGWTDFADGTMTPMRHVHQWGAQWQNRAGNIVDYTLRYSYPETGSPDLQSLWINGSWYPAAGVKAMQAITQRGQSAGSESAGSESAGSESAGSESAGSERR